MGVKRHRLGHWLPEDHEFTRAWLDRVIKEVEKARDVDLKRELREFEDLIEGDNTLKILASLMFLEVPEKPPYNHDPLKEPQIRDYHHMLQVLNYIMDSGPQWSEIADEVGLIGFPINAILDWPMCTSSGNAFFLRPDVSRQWERILNRWAVYLGTPDSTKVLTTAANGWLCSAALNELTIKGNHGVTDYSFDQLYVCNKDAEQFGFKSWDDFFTREFREGTRPLGKELFKPPQEHGKQPGLPVGDINRPLGEEVTYIYNACESTPVFLRRRNQVHEKAKFWLKGQPYSLHDMFNNDPYTSHFVGGTIYQAFLSALSYHRWHSPVTGTIKRVYNIPGTYYSANFFEGFANPEDEGGPDSVAPNNSQAYITGVAARAAIFIQADNPSIGLMGFLAIGMCEVSSNEITVAQGQHVKAGDQLGTFHFGGSTHCLVFRKGVDLVFAQEPKGDTYDPPPPYNTPLRAAIAAVVPSDGGTK